MMEMILKLKPLLVYQASKPKPVRVPVAPMAPSSPPPVEARPPTGLPAPVHSGVQWSAMMTGLQTIFDEKKTNSSVSFERKYYKTK